jgi:DNA-binding response OmpR family regulator
MNKQRTILLIEDDENIMAFNRRVLKKAGHHIIEAEDLSGARTQLAWQIPDVIVLDIILPDGNGLDFIPEIRAVTTAPILLLTALGKKDERIEGLRAGGDDYIAKPYDIDEFCERVAAFLRRGNMTPEKLTKGPLTMDLTSQQAFFYEDCLDLTQKEFSLLLLFMQKTGKSLTKEFIYEKVWGHPNPCDSNVLYTHFNRLRKKLEHHKCFEFSVSRNEGYSFNILS